MSVDPHPRLIRALLPHGGADAALIASRTERWGSATFTGMRHRLTIRTDASDADRLTAPHAAAMALPGHLLVELREVSRRRMGAAAEVEIDALTVEAG